MVKLYEYIKIKLYYLGCLENPLVAQLFYMLDAEIEKVRKLEAEYERLRVEHVRTINELLSKIDEDSRIAFEQYSKEVPTAPKRLLKAVCTARAYRRKARYYGNDSSILDDISYSIRYTKRSIFNFDRFLTAFSYFVYSSRISR